MITCIIRYDIDPFKVDAFNEYARNWGQAIPRCGADLIGYFAPHEGSATKAFGIYNIENLAAYEAYTARDYARIRSDGPTTNLPKQNNSSGARTAYFASWLRRRTAN